jgi:transcriptional regulator with XRE-family HTH domain
MFGERLKAARKNLGMTQDGLSEASGISRTQIARYEKGRVLPDLNTLIKLADTLDTSLDYLTERDKTYKNAPDVERLLYVDKHGKPPFTKDQLGYLEVLFKQFMDGTAASVTEAILEDSSSSKEAENAG